MHVVWQDNRGSDYEIYCVYSAPGSATGLPDSAADLPVTLSPNPTTGFFTITIPPAAAFADRRATVELVDCTGRVVYAASTETGTRQVASDGLRPGMYVVRATTSAKTWFAKLIVH